MSSSTATVRDLASHANVSIGTVSRVINHKPGVRPESEARVRQAIEELGYRIPQRRRAIHQQDGPWPRTGNIGLFMVGRSLEWARHPLYLSYLHGVSRACTESTDSNDGSAFHAIPEFCEKQHDTIRLVRDRKVDGLIIKGDPSGWLESLPRKLPVVALDAHYHDPCVDQVCCDDHRAGFEVAERLWELGHRRIVFATRDGRHPMLIHRLQGYEAFLRMQGVRTEGLSYVTTDVPRGHDPMKLPPSFDEAIERWWAQPVHLRPTAIIAANDWSAAGVYRALGQRGIRIPDDVSVVGFDNAVELCDSLTPSLSSHETPHEQAAFVATKMLINRIAHGNAGREPVLRLVRGRLVERQSICAVKHANASTQMV